MKIENQLDIMRSIASNLQKLARDDATTGPSTLARLEACKVQALERAGTDSAPPVDMVSIASARKAWNDAEGRVESLDRRATRILCWDPETCLHPSFYRALSRAVAIEQCAVLLRGMLTSYFQTWSADNWDAELAQYLTDSVRRFTGSSKVLNTVRTEATRLLARDGPGALAADFLDKRIEPKQLFERFGVPSSSRFAIASISGAVRIWSEWLNAQDSRGEAAILASWEFLKAKIVAPGTLTSADVSLLISSTVLFRHVEVMPGLQSEIRSFALGHPKFGDPRLHPNRWVSVRDEARRRFLNWLAKEWITFFFEEVLPKGADPHRRKDFWLQYAGRVVNFSVVLNDDDFHRLRPQIERHRALNWICRIVGAGEPSAFILQFQGVEPVTVIEFSLKNNAMYIFRSIDVSQRLGTIFARRMTRKDLKASSPIPKINHVPVDGWQNKARPLLAQLGIRP